MLDILLLNTQNLYKIYFKKIYVAMICSFSARKLSA